MPKYTVLEPLGYDRPAPYMPGETVDMGETEADGLIKTGVLAASPKTQLTVPQTVKLVWEAATIEELDRLAAGETRKGVLDAITAHRVDIEAAKV